MIVTTNMVAYVTYAKSAPAMKQYVKEKNGWADESFEMVDWDAMEASMSKVSIGTRVKAIKPQHNWQNMGQQKGLFLESAGASAEGINTATR